MAETEAKAKEMGFPQALVLAIAVTLALVAINYVLEAIAGG